MRIGVAIVVPRKEWVGRWIEEGPFRRYVDIGPHGGYRFTDTSLHHPRVVEGDIVAFVGNDLKVRTSGDRAEELVIAISDPPRKVKGTWIMTVERTRYYRSAP